MYMLRHIWVIVAVLGVVSWVRAQDPPALLVQPLTQKELNRRDALKQYVLGLLYEKDDKIFNAIDAYQESTRLDPEAPAVYKALAPLLATLEKQADAIIACKKALELDPGDFETWYMLARLHKTLVEPKEARVALEKALESKALAEHLSQAQQIHYELSTVLESLKEYKPAALACLEAAKILDNPEHVAEQTHVPREAIRQRCGEVYERVGHLFQKAKEPKRALDAFHLAQERNPHLASRISFQLAHLHRDLGDLEQSLKYLDSYLRFQPSGVEPYEMRMDLMGKLKRGDQALAWLDRTVQADPHNSVLRFLLAQQYVKTKQPEKAEKIFLELAEKDPNQEVYKELFAIYMDRPLGTSDILEVVNKTIEAAQDKDNIRPVLAATQGRAILAVIRDDVELSKQLVRLGLERLDFNNDRKGALKFETVHYLSHLAEKNRQADESERFYRALLARVRPSNEALVYSGLIRVLWKVGKFQEIVDVCQSGIQNAQATKAILFHSEQSKALARLDRFNESLKAADRAIDLAADTERSHAKHLRVRILVQAERFREAETECQELLKENAHPSEIMDVHYLLSHVYSTAKEYTKAEEQLEKILRIDPNNPTANNDLGYFWADQGKNLKEAEELIRRALDQDRKQRKTNPSLASDEDKDNAAYIDSLGWVLFRQGKLEEAKTELERAAALPEGNDPVMYDHLGDVLLRMGDRPAARAAFERAVNLYDQEKRRKIDDRYRDLQRKLKMLN